MALWCGWTHWLRHVVLRDQPYVCINLDETMVRHEYASPSGNVARAPRIELRAANLFFQRVRKDQEKAGTTLLALLCDNEALQPHLPQIWLPKDTAAKPMSGALRQEFRLAVADKYPQQVWGGSGGWMTSPLFAIILRLISRRVLARLGPGYVIVLIFDAAGPHATVEVLETAETLGMIVLLIPGQLTWLLQMLDVKVFGRLKARLRADFMGARLLCDDGRLPRNRWVSIAVQAVQDLLVESTWPRAFDTMRIPSPEVPANSFRRLQELAPTPEALPLMPMQPEEMDAVLGRHRLQLVPLLFGTPIRRMPHADRLELRDRLRRQQAVAVPAPAASAPLAAPPPLPLPAPPADAGGSIASRVALRRRNSGLP